MKKQNTNIHTTTGQYHARLREANRIKISQAIQKTIRDHTGSHFVDLDLCDQLSEEIASLMPPGTRLNSLYKLSASEILDMVEKSQNFRSKQREHTRRYITRRGRRSLYILISLGLLWAAINFMIL